jgi:hypothetical protein
MCSHDINDAKAEFCPRCGRVPKELKGMSKNSLITSILIGLSNLRLN